MLKGGQKGQASDVLCHSKQCVRFCLLTSGTDEDERYRCACEMFRPICHQFRKMHFSRCLQVLV